MYYVLTEPLIQNRIPEIIPKWYEKIDLEQLLSPIRNRSGFPDGFFEDRCLNCGTALEPYQVRSNEFESRDIMRCPKCGTFDTPAFNHGSRLPEWVDARVLYKSAKNNKDVDIKDDIEFTSYQFKELFRSRLRALFPLASEEFIDESSDLKPSKVTVPPFYRIRELVNAILEEAEPIILRYLSKDPSIIKGPWVMDVRNNDLPYPRSLLPGETYYKRGGHPHMKLYVVAHEAGMYRFSDEVMIDETRWPALHALTLALDRTGSRPAPLKIDFAWGLYKAAQAILAENEIERINKHESKESYGGMSKCERLISDFGQRDNKHHCQQRKTSTQQARLNIFRWYRNFLWPWEPRKDSDGCRHKDAGKTPAELLGIVLPPGINNRFGFLQLVKFSYRLTRYVKSEIARMEYKS